MIFRFVTSGQQLNVRWSRLSFPASLWTNMNLKLAAGRHWKKNRFRKTSEVH